jgi:hypothetical protein
MDPSEIIPPPDHPIRRRLYYIATNFWFDTTVNTLIIINMIPISLELSVDEDVSYFIVLRVLNYIFCSIYVSEAILKVWNNFFHHTCMFNYRGYAYWVRWVSHSLVSGFEVPTGVCTTEYHTNLHVPYLLSNVYNIACYIYF